MEPTKVDPVDCARLIVYNRIASDLCGRDRRSAWPEALAPSESTAAMTLDALIAREIRTVVCTDRTQRPIIPPNVALMIASIVSSVAVVLWCVSAQ